MATRSASEQAGLDMITAPGAIQRLTVTALSMYAQECRLEASRRTMSGPALAEARAKLRREAKASETLAAKLAQSGVCRQLLTVISNTIKDGM